MTTLLLPAPLITCQVLNRYTAAGKFDQEVQVESVSGTLAFLTDYATVFKQPQASGEVQAYRPERPAPTYRVREVPTLTSQQRHRLEAAVWEHTYGDFKGETNGQRCVMGLTRGGTCSQPLSAYTSLQLLDKLPAKVKPAFASYYAR
ncbi:hypothetical protein [Hymenobacter defluvii]|uniref:Uncharacterized protein n=1 Tax=Hymenobacter defluvii TaxID=2054411 RepID=A0ABS3THF3_9BACT|nr:hypothetical protein [Hymenobacter defluvii]MBO3273092.1 hypothetical protein [Hymenobacter defluvii]